MGNEERSQMENLAHEFGLGKGAQEALMGEGMFERFHAGLQEVVLKSSRHEYNLDQFITASRHLCSETVTAAFMMGVNAARQKPGDLGNAKRMLEEATDNLKGK